MVLTYSNIHIRKIIRICNSADIVVLWDLNHVKCYIANRVDKNVKIFWRFFGLELYSKLPEYVFTKRTIEILNQNIFLNSDFNLLKSLKHSISQIKDLLFSSKDEFDLALNRINYFLGLSDYEYFDLKLKWPNLPEFVQIPYSKLSFNEEIGIKENVIIVGNNRSAYNNHLDILELIKCTDARTDFRFQLLFNYGQIDKYTSAVKHLALQIKEVSVIEEFLSYQEFVAMYSKISAFVLNGHRQMAMANIFQALSNSVKLYLNEKNVIFSWLKKEGFLIFSIDDFRADIESKNLKLTDEEVEKNKLCFESFRQRYTVEEFHNRISNSTLTD